MLGNIALVLIPLLMNVAIHATSSTPSLSPVVIAANYGVQYEKVINNSIEYIFVYTLSNITFMDTERISVESNATENLPLIVVVRQTKGILSWQIPLLAGSIFYNKTSRILCSTKYYQSTLEDEHEHIIVGISTASDANIFFKLFVKEHEDFYVHLHSPKRVEISPAKPIYYGYSFPEQVDSSSVIVRVESDNDICMTVSLQNTSCPVFDLERNIEYSGYWQTMSRKGGITVSKEMFPKGFFIVLVVKASDIDCIGVPSINHIRTKNVTLTIYSSITKEEYIFASTLMASLIIVFCIIYIVSIVVLNIKEGRKLREETLNSQESPKPDESIPSPSTLEEVGPSQCGSIEDDSSLDEDDIDILEDVHSDKEVIRTKVILSVSDLAHKDPRILKHKSRLYMYYLGTVTVFYTLPVVQLVMTYQHMVHVTGNQDMCYYNFLCAHPLGLLSDSNHVFSNLGYVLLGLLFIFLTYSRENNEINKEKSKRYGIPQHYGLFYAMGLALIMEGILSASYHVCPNRSNFQFDTSYMYIIAVLCMIKIYQTRHPDINASAPATFGILAVIIFTGLLGVLNGSTYFWVLFTIIHLLLCLILTAQIYYMGRWKFNRGLVRRIIQSFKHDAHCGVTEMLRPLYPGRFVMLVIANLCNIGLAVVGNIYHEKNFATFLLAILMANLLLYTFFYITMKLCCGEKILLQPLIYILLAMLLWGAALYFFINKTISWAVTPAQSRFYNKPCKLLNFYDSHDIWHFLSALAMFFSFMVLLTLDDDLIDVHRTQIKVF